MHQEPGSCLALLLEEGIENTRTYLIKPEKEMAGVPAKKY